MGKVEFVPKVEAELSPGAASKAAVATHMGFVRFGGISVSELLPDEPRSDMIPMGKL